MRNSTIFGLLSITLFSFALMGVFNNRIERVVPRLPDTSSISSFTHTVNSGILNVDIVDENYEAVLSPSVATPPSNISFTCQTTTGTFGTLTQNIYVKNLDAADNGWVASLAAASPTDSWASAGVGIDFNDPTTGGCEDGADDDALKGQMTVNPAVGTLETGQCLNCVTTNVNKGSSAAFSEGVVENITILSASPGSDDIGDWKLTGVSVSQTIPAEQPAASDYNISLILTVVTS